MKKIIWLFAFILACLPTAFAQKVRYEKKEKMIYLDEKPYAKLYQEGNIMSADFSLKTLQEKEIVYFKYDIDKGQYEVIFMESNEKAYLENGALGGKGIAKHVVEHQFVKDNALNEDAKKRYLTLYGTKPSGNNVKNSNNTASNSTPVQYNLVERDKERSINTNLSNEITQDFKVIGTFAKSENFSAGTITYFIKLPNGTIVAEAVGKGISPQEYTITTYANRANAVVTVKYTTSPVEDIAKYLVDNGYL